MFDALFDLMGMMFLVILVGFVLRKRGSITNEGRKTLTDIILQVIIPCNIIKAFTSPLEGSLSIFWLLLGVGVGVNAFYLILCKFAFNKATASEKPIYQYATVCPNAGFMGNPLVDGVFGGSALTYASIIMLPTRIVMWTAGVAYFNENDDKKAAYKKVFTSPAMVATYIGMIIMLFSLSLPGVILSTVTSFSNCCTAFTMLYVGTILADVKIKGLFTKKTIAFSVLRLILIPLAIYLTCNAFGIDPLITGVAVLLSSTPAGSTTSLLAARYGADQEIATKVVVVSTLFSIITIPIWSMILLNGI